MKAKGVSHIAVCVADLEKSLEFYRDILRLTVKLHTRWRGGPVRNRQRRTSSPELPERWPTYISTTPIRLSHF